MVIIDEFYLTVSMNICNGIFKGNQCIVFTWTLFRSLQKALTKYLQDEKRIQIIHKALFKLHIFSIIIYIKRKSICRMIIIKVAHEKGCKKKNHWLNDLIFPMTIREAMEICFAKEKVQKFTNR